MNQNENLNADAPRRKGGLLRLATTAGVVALAGVTLAGVATGAFYTDTQTVSANTITTGTVDLVAGAVSANITASAMAPGDTVYGTTLVQNNGSLEFRYSLLSTNTTAATDGTLGATLSMTVKVIGAAEACNASTFSASAVTASAAGSFSAAAPGRKVFGDAATGAQAGDRVLAAGASERLCYGVILPSASDNTTQGKTTTADLRFDAEQTKNNA